MKKVFLGTDPEDAIFVWVDDDSDVCIQFADRGITGLTPDEVSPLVDALISASQEAAKKRQS